MWWRGPFLGDFVGPSKILTNPNLIYQVDVEASVDDSTEVSIQLVDDVIETEVAPEGEAAAPEDMEERDIVQAVAQEPV